MQRRNRIYDIITLIVIISLLVAFPISLWEKNWLNTLTILLTLILIFVVWSFQKKYQFKLPVELQLILILFIYAGVFLGGAQNFYYRFWWFDSLLHAISGLGLGFIGFLIPYSFYRAGKLKAGFFFIALFGFCFAVTLGVVWEIFEFQMDQFFGLNMQKANNLEAVYGYFNTRLGVIDTMHDLILDSIGAFIASVAGYIYLRKGEFFIFDRLVKRIERYNPYFFD